MALDYWKYFQPFLKITKIDLSLWPQSSNFAARYVSYKTTNYQSQITNRAGGPAQLPLLWNTSNNSQPSKLPKN
jgi:hypothetical protein